MKVQQFKKVLKVLEKIYEDTNAKKEGLASFAELFEGHETKTINTFANLVEKKQKSHISLKD